jgi:hypothetical protein
LSVLTYTYLYSRLFFPIFPIPFKNNLTPHVLSEWMVEVCRFEVCWESCLSLTPHVLSEWMVEVCRFYEYLVLF